METPAQVLVETQTTDPIRASSSHGFICLMTIIYLLYCHQIFVTLESNSSCFVLVGFLADVALPELGQLCFDRMVLASVSL